MKKIKIPLLFYQLFPFLFIAICTLPAITAIIMPGYFAMHDDLQAMRQLQMDKCFRDLQIPCRWVPDMGYGYGYPLFNYYPPLPYYIGEIFHLLGFSFLDTVKILFVLVFLLSGLSMYIFAKEFWGKLGGVISALFYIWAPYHAVDVYVRGAMNEAWALVFFPLILWSIYKIIKTNEWIFAIAGAFSISMLALSHIPTMMVFIPGAILWAVFWLWQEKNLASFPKLLVCGFWALGLSGFFIIPLIFELKDAHSETLFIGYFNYLAHFTNLNQLFLSRYWGYGESKFGPDDTMAFPLGHFHWVFSFIALLVAFRNRKKLVKISLTVLFFFAWVFGYTFLTHQRAAFVWNLVPQLANLQFPWRILALSMVGTSFLAGSVLLLFTKRSRSLKLMVLAVLSVALILFNVQFFTWREFYPKMTDQEKFSGKLWQLQQTSGIFDYLPKQLPLPPKDPAGDNAQIVSGEGNVETLKKNSTTQEYKVDIRSEAAVFKINTFYFPGWHVFVDGKEREIDKYRDKENGAMIIDLSRGNHLINARFTNTTARTAGDVLSLASWLIFLIMLTKFALRRTK